MDRRSACLALAALPSLAVLPARAQSGRIARVAWASVDRANPDSPFLRAFREGLKGLGWVEGRNLVVQTWWGGGSTDGLARLVPEIVASRPDLIVSAGGPATRVMINGNVAVPVAFTVSADVVLGKFVESWARPGVNRTGISFFSLELVPRRLQLMKEVKPDLMRVAIVGWPPHAGELLELDVAKGAAEKLGLEHRYFGVNTATELEAAFETIAQWKAGAILAFAGAITSAYPDRFAAFAARSRIPSFSSWAVFAEAGNFMTHGPVLAECYARLASFVDRILKGAKPAEIPAERPTKFELVVNLKAASALGIAVPPQVLLRADRVIE